MFRFDQSDAQCMVIYTGTEPLVPEDYREMHRQWIACLEKGERFGIIVVSEPPTPRKQDYDAQQARKNQAEVTDILNEFRRNYRPRTAQMNVGYARVMPQEWIVNYFAKKPGDWERSLADNDRYTHYNWGIPGGLFVSLADAQAWIWAQFDHESAPPIAPLSPNKRVGLYYGSSTGVTEEVAFKIGQVWIAAGREALDPINIAHVKEAAQLLTVDYLVLGISTWNTGQLQDDWAILFPQLDALDFSGKKVALFGVGDQINYPDNFLDAMGILGHKLRDRGAELVGYWHDEHYKFRASKAFAEGRFIGLGVDELRQANLSELRIKRWVVQVIDEFALQSAVDS